MADKLLLEDGTSRVLLEDGSSFLLLEAVDQGGDPAPLPSLGLLLAASGGGLSVTIDTAGAITLAGQSVTFGRSVALSNGAITFAGQSVTPALTIPVSNGAIAIAGQSHTMAFGIALATNGAIGIAGQTITPAITVPISNGAITLAGQSITLANGANLSVSINVEGSITFAGQSVTLVNATNLTLDIDVAGLVTVSGQSAELSLSGVQTEQPSGGYGYSNFEALRYRMLLRKKRKKELEEQEREIQDALDRQIAQSLYEQELKDAERADLERIQSLADSLMTQRTNLQRPILASVIKAHEERTRNSLLQLERMIAQSLEEEEIAAIVAILFDD